MNFNENIKMTELIKKPLINLISGPNYQCDTVI